MLKLVEKGTISGKIAKTVFEEMYRTGKDAGEIVKEKGLVQISDESAIEKAVDEIIAKSPKEVERYKAGDEKLLGFFVGQVMKATKGKANPQDAERTAEEKTWLIKQFIQEHAPKNFIMSQFADQEYENIVHENMCPSKYRMSLQRWRR